jgi:flagellar hook-basal body protein
MQVISNNIANVNTVGFKAGRTNFEDLVSQDYWSNGKIQQIGRGVKVASVQQMFTQGSFMNSAQDTDMAITGEGFFQVRDRVTNELMYTRAGNFTFDAEGVLETPAGYVLQGWELSIPKPGAEPVRIGTPVDVKVIVLNAPPVETSQIKVVANLNADDTSAYLYSQSAWAGEYAHSVADPVGEAARLAAMKNIYYYPDQGSAYPNASMIFNDAYVTYMSANGFIPGVLGQFTKTDRTEPNSQQLTSAYNYATSAAWNALNISGGTYPISATSSAYETAYNNAYFGAMSAWGFKLSGDTFVKYTSAPASLRIAANTTAISAAGLPPAYIYPSTNTIANTAYLSAYAAYMSSKGYDHQMANIGTITSYTIPPNTADLSTASAAALIDPALLLLVPGYSSYPARDPSGDATYVSAFINYMSSHGFIVSPAYVPGDTDLSHYSAKVVPDLSEQGAADAAALLDPGLYPGYTYPNGVPANDEAYVAAYVDYMTNTLGYTVTPPYTVTDDLSVFSFSSPGPNPTHLADANTAALSDPYLLFLNSSYLGYPSPVPAEDAAYVSAYVNYMVNNGFDVDHPYSTPDSILGLYTFTATSALTPTGLANAAALSDPGLPIGYTVYPTVTPINTAADALYVSAFVAEMISQGYTVNTPYVTGDYDISHYSFTITPNPSQITLASAAGLASAIAAGAPSSYTYPSGTNLEWDDAYATAFKNSLSTQGFSVPLIMPTFYQKYPSALQISQATGLAKTAAQTALGPLSGGYPSQSTDPTYKAAYDLEYETYMLAQGFSLSSTPPPYFVQETYSIPTSAEIAASQAAARTLAEQQAANAGQIAYNAAYQPVYDAALASISGRYAPWQLEGMGFAGAWDGTDLESPIDPENYTHANPWTIYDSLGNAHTLMVYYQPNPHMENVWDYIITCDPTEDARKDLNNNLVMNGSTFAGIIQKGKITFTADGPDRHGGLVKDIEAQNIDMSRTAAASLSSSQATVSSPATASSMNYAKLGGYYTGDPIFSATTGSLVDNPRQYTIQWVGNLSAVPTVSGFVWSDNDGNSGTIPIYDKNYTGPYPFGSGLNVSFSEGGRPMNFTSGDKLTFNAHSEQIAWTNLTPNAQGYFDFDVAFVQSASMALHPPYPQGMPTIIQHISLDMGARNPNGQSGSWILDEQGTTQYASKSINIFSSQDGYPAGSLQRVSIDKDGILTGIYTNVGHQPLYQIGLARFLNPWGLAKLGDNVYMETRWSGTGTINPPGYGGTGTIRANFLEQSNTDLADEIVNMIVTQRGFQANSKVVTTTDTMLAEVIEMKR